MLGFFVSITLQPGANVPDMKEKLALTGADVYYRTSKEMRSTINARFSTAEETAKVFHVCPIPGRKSSSVSRVRVQSAKARPAGRWRRSPSRIIGIPRIGVWLLGRQRPLAQVLTPGPKNDEARRRRRLSRGALVANLQKAPAEGFLKRSIRYEVRETLCCLHLWNQCVRTSAARNA